MKKYLLAVVFLLALTGVSFAAQDHHPAGKPAPHHHHHGHHHHASHHKPAHQ